MKEYFLPDANFGVEDSELYRSNLLALIYELTNK